RSVSRRITWPSHTRRSRTSSRPWPLGSWCRTSRSTCCTRRTQSTLRTTRTAPGPRRSSCTRRAWPPPPPSFVRSARSARQERHGHHGRAGDDGGAGHPRRPHPPHRRPFRQYSEDRRTMIIGVRGTTVWSEDLNRLLPFYRDRLGLPVAIDTPGFVVLGRSDAHALALGTHS